MIDEKTIWEAVWPVVENLIESTLAEDAATMRTLLTPDGQAAVMLDLFDVYVYDILLKTVLGREQLGVSRAVETENGRFIHIEYAWPEPGSAQNGFTANDVVTVSLTQFEGRCVKKDVEYDPTTGKYVVTEKVGDQNVKEPLYLTYEEYLKYNEKQERDAYFKSRSNAVQLIEQKGLIPSVDMKNPIGSIVWWHQN